MRHLINFSLFLFDCIDIINNNKNLRFTYKTNNQGFNKINKSFNKTLSEICKSENFYTRLSKRKNDHPVDDIKTKTKIEIIFLEKKYPQKWIDDYIWNSIIYQLEFNNKKQRLFYITERNENNNVFIIKPLFLDLNHAIFPDNSRDNIRYEKCLVCNNEKNVNKNQNPN